jgi:hypothetical protein
MDVAGAITLAIAVLGAVLGVMNLLHERSQSKVKLRVVPKLAAVVDERGTIQRTKSASGPVDGIPCIEVINLSAFAVTVSEVGFTVKGNKKQRFATPMPELIDEKPWPRRLDSRESVSTYLSLPQQLAGRIDKAYAVTECGHKAYGSSPALVALREWGSK